MKKCKEQSLLRESVPKGQKDRREVVGYTTGVFDLFHIGHLNLLRNAKSMCDKLIVGVTTDELVSYKKKESVIPFSDRIEILGSLGRIDDLIRHDEGRISLWRTLRKKYYYAKRAGAYVSKSADMPTAKKRKVGILGRYRIFFSDPRKLFRNPVVGAGMLLMKTGEFGFGITGYLMGKIG